MTGMKRKFQFIFVILLQSKIWSISTGIPTKKVLYLQNNYEESFSTTPKPFVRTKYTGIPSSLKTITLPPLDYKTTEKPYFWKNFTLTPVGKKSTLKPFVWKNFTLPPVDYKYRITVKSTTETIGITGGVIFLICLISFVLKNNYCFRVNTSSRESPTRRTSRTVRSPPQRISQLSQNTTVPQRIGNFSIAGNGTNFDAFAQMNCAVSSDISDRPPSYFDVISDVNGKVTKFPKVFPKVHETRPPKYHEGYAQKY